MNAPQNYNDILLNYNINCYYKFNLAAIFLACLWLVGWLNSGAPTLFNSAPLIKSWKFS